MKIENISTLKINRLTQEQYEKAKAEDKLNDSELYFTPASPTGGDIDVTEYAYSKTETYSKAEVDAKIPSLDGYAKTSDIPDISGKQDKLTFDGTYNASTNKAATVQTVRDEVAKIVADAPEDFNTLKEMSTWIAEHTDDASAMNSAIQKNTQDIANMQEEIVSEKDEFHIVDKDDNIVATIDKDGVHSVAFLDKDGNELTNLTPLFTRTKLVSGMSGTLLTDLGYSAVITLDTKCRSVRNVKLLKTNNFNSQEITISAVDGTITVSGWADTAGKIVSATVSYTAAHADHASSAETCATTPTLSAHIANKKYVDDEIYKFSSGDNTVKTAQTANALKSGYNVNSYGSEISVYFNTGRAYVILVAYQMYNYTGIFVNVGGTQEFMLYGTAADNGIKCKYNSTASTLTFTKDGTSIAAGSCYVREL